MREQPFSAKMLRSSTLAQDSFEFSAGDDKNDSDNISIGSSESYDSCNDLESQRLTEEQEILVKQESRAIFCLRVIVCLVLLASAIAVCLTGYLYMSNVEEKKFLTQLESDATKIVEGIADSFDNYLGSVDKLALTVVSYARSTNQTWPFVTYPDFAVQGFKVLKSSGALQIDLHPLVRADQRDAWEKYASENDDWVAKAIEMQSKDPEYKSKLQESYFTSPIYGFPPVTGPSPLANYSYYVPSWQDAPVIPLPFPYNLDGLHTSIGPGLAHVMRVKRPALAGIFSLVEFGTEDAAEAANIAIEQGYASNFVGPNDIVAEPSTALGYPIIDRVDSVRLDGNEDLPMVGVFHSQFYWRDLIKNILPSNSRGLILVVESDCVDQFVTFQIDGVSSTFLGTGDLHDSKFDHLGIHRNLADVMSSDNPNRDSSYTGLPLDAEYCSKVLHVYPSKQMQGTYITYQPAIFTAVAATIMVFTALVFLAYDWLVAYRQKIVMKRAMASSEIVSGLFPKTVVQTLYDENARMKEEEAKRRKFRSQELKRSIMLANSNRVEYRPIADEFEGTTIFFADLVGFTAWSSKRTPTEVFELLEALYGAFDKIAKRRGVFKIETIGDCYVAVTGIPEAQDDHAIRMTKFTREVLTKMNELTHELVDTLGPDTADLRMRVGLHSGSTTAGVLRGDKGRFQLFGDTVNTAARMESNGVPDHIHVSQATADELIAKGKSHWLKPREEKIMAKGKGLMQTYFISAISGKSIRSKTTASDCASESVKTTTVSDSTSEIDISNCDMSDINAAALE